MAWSTPDLSDITAVLTGLLQSALNAANPSASNIKLYNTSPDAARKTDGYCHLTLYLLHVGRDPYWRNTPVAGPRPQLNNAQPLSLNLSYLLTAWDDVDFASEQRAMSIALQAIHSTPIVTQKVIQNDALSQYLPQGEFTVSIEADTIEEMSRLWQAITAPIRLSALIRAGVVFIAPAVTPLAPKPAPTVANLSVSPEPTPPPPPPAVSTQPPLLFAGGSVSMQAVLPATADPNQIVATNGPVTAVGGSTLVLAGNALNLPDAAQVFLSGPGIATPLDVTAWRQTPTLPASQIDQLWLTLPTAYADPASGLPAPPAALPTPGLFSLSVGSTALATRSNAIPIAIAPLVTGVAIPPQLLPNAAGVYAIAGAGFAPAQTIVALGTTPLAKVAGPAPAAGQFTVTATAIQFMLPSPAPANGAYPVLIQVNGIAAAPGWVVVVGP
jgi:hypothetical protein